MTPKTTLPILFATRGRRTCLATGTTFRPRVLGVPGLLRSAQDCRMLRQVTPARTTEVVQSGGRQVTCHRGTLAPSLKLPTGQFLNARSYCRAVSCQAQHLDTEKKITNHRTFCGYYFYLRRLIYIFTANIAGNENLYLPTI